MSILALHASPRYSFTLIHLEDLGQHVVIVIVSSDWL